MPEVNTYGEIAWTADDVQTLANNWTLEQCEDWLQENAKYVRDRLIELGWEVMENMLPSESRKA